MIMENRVLSNWHVLYVKPRQEKKVESILKEKKIDVFLPLIMSIKIWSDRKKKNYSPLFPRYIFAEIKSKVDFYTALSSAGVVKYVKFGNDYARVRGTEILQIKQLLNLDAVSEIKAATNMPFKGQNMKINYGPLSGMDCIVIKVNKKSKILVKIESIRHCITACVPDSFLTPTIIAENL